MNLRCVFVLAAVAVVPSLGSAQSYGNPGDRYPDFSPAFSWFTPSSQTSDGDSRIWFDPQFLLWWVKDGPTPGPLVTTGPPSAAPGALGTPGTVVLYGDEGIDYRAHAGCLVTLGGWLNDERTLGCELRGLLLETHTYHFALDSDKNGTPVIARPFFNVLTGKQDAQVLTAPGSFFGGIDVFSDSRLWGGELNVIRRVEGSERGSLSILGGLRYLGLDESLRISQSTTVLPGGPALPLPPAFQGVAVPAPDILSLTDRFETRNEFIGGQIGAQGTWRLGRFTADLLGKVGLGTTLQSVNLRGVTELTTPAGRAGIVPFGLFAVGDNTGQHSRDRLTFISEIGLRLGCDITPYWSMSLGWDFLYWGDIARPGEQMSLVMNPQVIPSNLAFGPVTAAAEPLRRFASSSYWAQGLMVGTTIRY